MTKKQTITTGTIILCLLILRLVSYAQQTLSSATYKLDIKQSRLFWKIEKTLRGGHNGFILFSSGSIDTYATGQPANASFIINMNGIKTTDITAAQGSNDVDNAIKSNSIFDVQKYPTATMIVKKMMPTNDPVKFKVSGDLTLKGITKSIDFIATIKQQSGSLKATASFKIDRTKWQILYKSEGFWSIKDELIKDNIDISLNLVFYK